jgi:hypothetical protein
VMRTIGRLRLTSLAHLPSLLFSTYPMSAPCFPPTPPYGLIICEWMV